MERGQVYMPNSLRICIDQYENGCMAGCVYSPLQETPVIFADTIEMVAKTDRLFDEKGYPQAYQKRRLFQEHKTGNPVSYNLNPEMKLKDRDMERKKGLLETYDVLVISRKNTSWQGEIKQNGKKHKYYFHSVLELVQFLDDSMDGK